MNIANPAAETKSRRRWWLFWLLALILAMAAWLVAFQGNFSVDAIRRVIRLTAQMSLILFCTAFSASAMAWQWPGPTTFFLRRYRRQIGVSFAFSHGLHALALVAFAKIAPSQFHETADTAMFVFGGLAYVFIAAMTITSFDQTAAWLGTRRWKLLHTVGSYDIWLVFLIAEGKRAVHNTYYWPYVALLLTVMVLRWVTTIMRARQST